MIDVLRRRFRPLRRALPPLNLRRGLLLAAGAALVALVLVGETWRVVAYTIVALGLFLVLLAAYFWGVMLLGGGLEALRRRGSSVPWTLGALDAVPEHDIDPGLELLAAGILTYREGEVRPHIHFRAVPLDGVRAIRPFVVARTGSERAFPFGFALADERDRVRFRDEFERVLRDAPLLVAPSCRLTLTGSRGLEGRRWQLQVRAGATVLTTFRFTFLNGSGDAEDGRPQAGLVGLIEDALGQDALRDSQEIILER